MAIGLILKAIVIVTALGLGFGIKYITSNKAVDAEVEKIAEEAVKYETGIDFDFQKDEFKKDEPKK